MVEPDHAHDLNLTLVWLPHRATGYVRSMDDDQPMDDERVSSRAELLPEEKAVGSEDPEGQARAIIADSDARTASREASPGTHLEHRTSDEATPPPDA